MVQQVSASCPRHSSPKQQVGSGRLRVGATCESRDVSANEPIDVEQHDHAIGNGYETPDIVGGAAGAEIGRGLHFFSVDVDDIRYAVHDDTEVPPSCG